MLSESEIVLNLISHQVTLTILYKVFFGKKPTNIIGQSEYWFNQPTQFISFWQKWIVTILFSLLLWVQDEEQVCKILVKSSCLNVIMTDFKGQWRCLILLVTFFGTIWCQVLNVQRCSDPSCQGKSQISNLKMCDKNVNLLIK